MVEKAIRDHGYERIEKIASGGFGEIYRAHQISVGRDVAIKVVLPDLAADPLFARRFEEEAHLAAQLEHPNIVPLYEYWQSEGRAFLVMRWLAGGSLKESLKNEPWPSADSVRLIEQVAGALEAAHRQGVIHRDLKSSNILLDEAGNAYLSDFGIAKRLVGTTMGTPAGAVLGSPAYMAPEQIRGDEVTTLSDLYSLGIVLFKVLTGDSPFGDNEPATLLYKQLHEPLPLAGDRRSDLPPAVDPVIQRATSKDPVERYPDTVTMVSAFREAMGIRDHSGEVKRPEPLSQQMIPSLSTDFPAPNLLEPLPNNLPTQPTPFIGRKAELNALNELISDQEIRLVTILGAGGMGKTRLALTFAEEQLLATKSVGGKESPRFPDGVFFVSLAPLDSAERLASAIAKAVSFQFYQGVEPTKQLFDYFRDRTVLLIMDNFDHLLDGVGLIAGILQAAPEVKILATSREKLNLRGEISYSLQGMAFPTDGITEEASLTQIEDGFSAVKLFVESARRLRSEIEFTPGEMRDIVRICRLVDGMPLGIELAVTWTEMLSTEEIALEIQGSLDFLKAERRDAPERHQSIRAVFDYTWKNLEPEEREIFERLSIFQGGFTRGSAKRVTGAPLKVLRALVNRSLVRSAQDGRYEMHELLRQYAEEKLDDDLVKKDQMHDRHSEYFAEFLHQGETAIRSGRQGQILSEMDNIRAALRWSIIREKIPEIRKQMQSLWWLYEFQGLYQEAKATFEWAASVLGTNSPAGERGIAFGQVLTLLGVFSWRTGEIEKGTQLIRKSQALLRELKARLELAWASVTLGLFGVSMGYEELEQNFKESLAIYEEMGSAWGIAFTHNSWGHRALQLGRYEEAERHNREAIRINTAPIDRRTLAWSLGNLGEVAFKQGDYKKAKKYLEESYILFKTIDYKILIGDILTELGNVALLMGEYEEAHARHQEALDVFKDSAYQTGIATSYSYLGNVAFRISNYETAIEHYKEALARFQSLDDQNGAGRVLGYLGNVATALGDQQEARAK